MPSVDNRVVRMEFDNSTFQAKIKQTLDSLSQLDKALKMQGATKGLTDISKAASQVKLDPIHTAVDKVSTGFLAMSTIAITALSQITSRAVSAGAAFVKSFTFGPILDGFQEFETNIGSIQTILANTRADGTGLDDVNKALNQLNAYSDKTIYNFGQMARNIGTFTAAGVDLNTSVQSIKGISNLAAISGSSAEQASTAMYQLSQAISTGTLRLIDWNSVVNAGMGGEVFQKALFETGKALGTIKDVPIGATFEEWTKKSGSFRDSLQDGWLTSEVLTTTLQGFTGEMTKAQLLSKGYTEDQADAIIELGKSGVEAATRIRTLSQLLNTVKETIGSGWSATFRTVIGDFNESSELFTNINNSISGFVNASADARNAVLQDWKDLGGRTLLINSLKQAFKALGDILRPIKDAFRDIFPKKTGSDLFKLTSQFYRLVQALKPSEQTIQNLGRIFKGLFSILDIGWEVIKAGVSFIKDLIVQFTGLGSGNILKFAANIGDFFTNLRESLGEGDAIHGFFDRLRKGVEVAVDVLKEFGEAVANIFGGFSEGAADAASAGVDRLSQRFSGFRDVLSRIGDAWKPFQNFLEKVTDILNKVGKVIGDWFRELGQKLADQISPGEFNNVLDALNVGLLGGIAALLGKWLKGGINLDFGGTFEKIGGAFEQLTGTLKAMQTQIKAQALVKIATAVGILTASVVALSLINSAALTRALTAMAVGFGQLMAAFAVLNKMDVNVVSGATFNLIATGMTIMAGALIVLAGAVAAFGSMKTGTLVKGLTSVTIALGVMVGASVLLSKFSGTFILASVGITALSVGLTILAGAVFAFSRMKTGSIAKGLIAIGAALLIIAGAMSLMPANLPLTAAGIVALSVGLNILAGAMKIFATMSWGEIAKGLVAVVGGLLLIAGAMQAMPITLPITAAGLILVGVALGEIAGVMKLLATMSWTEIAKGLVAFAGSLLILTVAANAMNGAIAGAAAMVIMAAAMGILGSVLIKLSKVKFGDIIKAIGGLAIAIAVLGGAAALLQPIIPAMLGLGAALLLVGGSFALFGIGALATAKAFEIIAKAGPEAADSIVEALKAIGRAIPALLTGLAQGIIDFIMVFVKAAPVVAEALSVLIGHILDTLIKAMPKLGQVIGALGKILIDNFIKLTPDFVRAGIGFILALIRGLNERMDEIIEEGTKALKKFLRGISDNLWRVLVSVNQLISVFIAGVTASGQRLINSGANAIIKLVQGFSRAASRVVQAGVSAVISFVKGLSSQGIRLANAAFTILTNFLNALADVIRRRSPELRRAGLNIASAIIDGITGGIASKAGGVIDKFVGMAKGGVNRVKNALGIDSPSKVFFEIGQNTVEGFALGLQQTAPVDESAKAMGKTATDAIQKTITDIAEQMARIDQFNPTITPVLDLTKVEADAARISSMIANTQTLAPAIAINASQAIAKSPNPAQRDLGVDSTEGGGDVNFVQNNYSPTQLSTSDIYKKTRNQITLAKEELHVP